MALKAKKIQTLTVPLETKPGALLRVYSAFREAEVDVVATWGYEMGPGQAQAIVYADDFNQAKTVLSQMKLNPKPGWAVWVEGNNEVGAYADVLQKVAKANLNLHATDAIALGGKFATVLFAEEKDISAICKILGC